MNLYKLTEWVKTAFQLWVTYSVLWIPFWLVAWLMQLTGDPTTEQIYGWVLIAGYPGLGLVYAFGAVLGAIFYAVLGLFALTMPWGLYAAPFLALGVFLWLKLFRTPAPRMTQQQITDALRRSAPKSILS